MILSADIGNSNICIALQAESSPKPLFLERLSTSRDRTAAEFASDISLILLLHGISRTLITGAALSSVVPELTPVLSDAMTEAVGVPVFTVSPESKLRFTMSVAPTDPPGADIICDLTGAVMNYPAPIISVLPAIGLEDPGPAIGTKTADAVKSGIIYGSAGLVDGLIDQIEKSAGRPCTIVATGGLSRFVIPYCRHKIIYDPELLTKGIWQLWKDNQ